MIARPVLGLVSHNARLVLDEGSVPTAVFGLICPGSLATPKPLMYRLAMEFIGPGTRQGREFTGRWQYPGFRRVFRVITTAWGTAYLAEPWPGWSSCRIRQPAPRWSSPGAALRGGRCAGRLDGRLRPVSQAPG